MDSICRFVSKDDDSLDILPLRFVLETELKNFSQPLRTHCYRLMVVTKGSATLTFYGKNYLLAKNNLCFFAPNSCFTLEMDDDFTVIYLDFNSNNISQYFASKNIDITKTVFKANDTLTTFLSEAINFVRNYNSNLLIKSCILYTLSNISFLLIENQYSATSNGVFNTILDFVKSNFNDPMLSLKKLAERFSYSQKHLSRLFATKLGTGFNKFINGLRLDFAAKLLDEGNTSIKNIAYTCGFLDPLYFSRAFKKRFNVSPKEYFENSPLRVERDFYNKYK